jgi:hypothetical protein
LYTTSRWAGRSCISLIGERGFLDRSAIFTAIDNDERTTVEIEQQAKGIVNSVFNAVTAECLEQDLLSIDRSVPLRPRDSGHGRPKRHGITVALAEPLGDSELRALSRVEVTWEDIYRVYSAWADPVLSKDEVEKSLDNLVSALAERRIAIPSTYVGPIVSKAAATYGPSMVSAASLLVPYFSGALEHFSETQTFVSMVATMFFGTFVAETGKRALKGRTKRNIKSKLTGWLERCGGYT